ncbi:wsv447 [White spot syndrome virus]|uniref:Wsv447 n=1 Tax=White spot syndrome virus TaxID=342409 RepID=A0A1Z2R9Q5_9VIRU|nr:wsv447 [White spot syndrome virus]
MGSKRPCSSGQEPVTKKQKKNNNNNSNPVPVINIKSYPFLATRTQVLRSAVAAAAASPSGSSSSSSSSASAVKLPDTCKEARKVLSTVSLQQSLAVRYLCNSISVSYAGGGISVFHLGGLPGAGKTTMVKELIAVLNDHGLIDSGSADMLLCCKSNSAKESLMCACKKPGGSSLMYPESVFSTLNKGFEIPVIFRKDEITLEKIQFVADKLKWKVIQVLANLRFLVIDEYTMVSCRELVFIDAVLRIAKHRPDIPFGGVFVILLGDNRQNSAVVEDNTNHIQKKIKNPSEEEKPQKNNKNNKNKKKKKEKKEKGGEEEEGDENEEEEGEEEEEEEESDDEAETKKEEEKSTFFQGSVEQDNFGQEDNAKLYTEVFIKILKMFCSRDFFGNPSNLRNIVNKRHEAILMKSNNVKSVNNNLVSSAIKVEDCGNASNKKEVTAPSSSPAQSTAEENCDEFDDEEDDDFFNNEAFLKLMERNALEKDRASGALNGFSLRCKSISDANEKIRSGTTSVSDKKSSLDMMKSLPLSALIEEGICSELAHISELKKMSNANLEKYTENVCSIVFDMMAKAMREIDYSGREKLYIVSSLSERFKDTHLTSLMDEEILNVKYVHGSDPKCIDAVPFNSAHNRASAVAACVRNAFFRDGKDFVDETPIANYFKDNLRTVASFLENETLTYKELLAKSENIRSILLKKETGNNNSASSRTAAAAAYYEDDEDYCYFDEEEAMDLEDGGSGGSGMKSSGGGGDDDDEESGEMIYRTDIPDKLHRDASTLDRVGHLVDFHVVWKKWLTENKPSDLVRARVWYLYTLVRMQQVKFDNGKLPSLDKSALSGRLFHSPSEWATSTGVGGGGGAGADKPLHDEYWLRVLSMPISTGGDVGKSMLLPAYSSYLSALSRTYIMSSLKRIDIIKHAYSLMYGISLFDMTANLQDLVDTRMAGRSSRNGSVFMDNFDPVQYFDNIFPSMVNEFLMYRKEDVFNNGQMMEGVKGSLKISRVLQTAHTENNNINNRHNNSLKYSEKSIVLAMQMVTSISKGNERRKKIEEFITKEQGQPKDMCERLMANSKAKQEKDAISSKTDKMMGAITLTKKHVLKNAVSNLVDTSIIKETKKNNNNSSSSSSTSLAAAAAVENSVPALRVEVKFVVLNMDLSDISHEKTISHKYRQQLINAIKTRSTPLFDKFTDRKILRAAESPRALTTILLDEKKKVTRAKSITLYQGQNVIFTTSNRMIHGTQERFVTKDTGVVTNLMYKNGELTVFVYVERLGQKCLEIKEGRQIIGNPNIKNGGFGNNVYVQYLPFESSQAMTIYSCQGHTFFRDTIVDLSGASTQDAYVAVTRNSNPQNLFIIQNHSVERGNLCNIKCAMSKDKAYTMPIGGIADFNGSDFINHDTVSVSREVAESSAAMDDDYNGDGGVTMYSAYDPSKDVVAAAEEFILSRSGKSLSFNASWMANTAKVIQQHGLETELKNIRDFFFGVNNGDVAKHYEKLCNKKMIELYTAIVRSITHYSIASGIVKQPSSKLCEEYETKQKNKKDYIKIHPVFVNRAPKESTIEMLLFDIAPHNKATIVFQFYVHFIFLVYEKLNVLNSSFAFLPSPNPCLNQYVRPKSITTNSTHVPNLGYESKDFAHCKDGGERDVKLRLPITSADEFSNNIEGILKKVSDTSNQNKVNKYMDVVCKSMQHNLRRTGKFCRPTETCGLSKHGSIVTATCTAQEKGENIHVDAEKGWLCMSDEANVYCMLMFMSKIAAASGVSEFPIKDKSILESNPETPSDTISLLAPRKTISPTNNLHFSMSEDVLFCGQVHPMKRVQFSLHVKRTGGALKSTFEEEEGLPTKIFSPNFATYPLFKKCKMYGAIIIAMTEMQGHEFAKYSTLDIRKSMFTGVGTVVDLEKISGEGNEVMDKVDKFIVKNVSNILFKEQGKRVSFFVSCAIH